MKHLFCCLLSSIWFLSRVHAMKIFGFWFVFLFMGVSKFHNLGTICLVIGSFG